MRIITCNVNGIRSAVRKGFFSWLATQQADVVCVQETKAQCNDAALAFCGPEGYHNYYCDAQKKGYSGVAIFSRQKPDRVHCDLPWPPAAGEGRFIQTDFGKLSVISVYLPSGSSGEERQAVKFKFMQKFMGNLQAWRHDGREYILCGDWNIVHKQIDIKNWKSNQKNSGCLPEERAWLERVFSEVGFVDAFRVVNQQADQYTWWSNRGQAWAKNVGWRIDYHLLTPGLRHAVKKAHIYKEQRFSDHAPLIIDYNLFFQ